MNHLNQTYNSIKYRYNGLPNKIQIIIIALSVSLIYILPLLTISNGVLNGDDLHFHIDRMLGLSSIWKSPVNFRTFYKVGQGVNYFYPYITYYPYYLLYRLTHSFYMGWMLYLYFLTTITYLIAYYSSKNITKNFFVAHLFAIFYVFASYRLDNIVIRFAIGEAIAITFLPLVFYGLYLIIKGNYKKWYYLAFGMTLVIYSHILSSLLTAIIVGAIFLTTIWFTNKRGLRTYHFSLAVAATFLMSSFQILPMLEQFHFTSINNPGGDSLNLTTKPLSALFTYSLTNDLPMHVPGLLVLVCLVLSLFYIRKFKFEDFYLSVWVVILILLESTIIKWPDSPKNFINVIQFSWRLNSYITLFSLFLASKWIANLRFKFKQQGIILAIILLSILNFTSVSKTLYNTFSYPPNVVGELSYRNGLHKLTNSVLLKDYINNSENDNREFSDQNKKASHKIFINDTEEELLGKFSFKDAYVRGTITNDKESEKIIELPFYRYKGQVVTVDNRLVSSALSKSGSTAIHLPNGVHEVRVTYYYTAVARVAFAISIIVIIVTIIYAVLYHLIEKHRIAFKIRQGLLIYY